VFEEKFEDTGSHKSKDRQCNDQNKKDKAKQNIIRKPLNRELTIEQLEPHKTLGVNSGDPGG